MSDIVVYYVDGTQARFPRIESYETKDGFLTIIKKQGYHNYKTTIIPSERIEKVEVESR